MGHSDGQQNCFVMNLDHCADTRCNVTGLWEGKQDNECRLVIKDLKGKRDTLGCWSPPQATCISAVLVRHWVDEELLWWGCFPLSLHLSAWNTSHAPFYLLSFHVVDSYISTCRIISASMGWQRLSPRPMTGTLPAPGFTWNKQAAYLCAPVLWKTQIFQSSFPEKKQVTVCGYQHMQTSWNRNEICSV